MWIWTIYSSISSEREGSNYVESTTVGKLPNQNFNKPGTSSTPLRMFLMAEIEYLEAQGLKFHNAKESLEDKYSKVFDTIILHDSIEAAKIKLKTLQLQGIDTHGVFGSYFFYFSVEQTPSC